VQYYSFCKFIYRTIYFAISSVRPVRQFINLCAQMQRDNNFSLFSNTCARKKREVCWYNLYRGKGIRGVTKFGTRALSQSRIGKTHTQSERVRSKLCGGEIQSSWPLYKKEERTSRRAKVLVKSLELKLATC